MFIGVQVLPFHSPADRVSEAAPTPTQNRAAGQDTLLIWIVGLGLVGRQAVPFHQSAAPLTPIAKQVLASAQNKVFRYWAYGEVSDSHAWCLKRHSEMGALPTAMQPNLAR